MTAGTPSAPDSRGDSCPERLEIAVDHKFNRVLRSSHRPEQQIVVGRQAWAVFVATIRAGQDY
ncbi:hypothetical protein AB0C50_16760 [Micromonospora taraxaci]|uniref:hypothetical protein n=1 Tax=Micromonospora taraxaci TaxID=1316803 RepID=UPI0033CFD4C0